MPAPFSRTLRSIASDHSSWSTAGLLVGAALLGIWTLWFAFSTITLYEVSDSARLEAAGAAHPVATPVDGRVVATRLAMGREVKRGDVLVELDSESLRAELEEKRRTRDGLALQIEATAREISSEERSRLQRGQSDRAAAGEMRARCEQAEAAAGLAEQEAQRQETLHAGGLLPTADLRRAQAEAQQRRLAAESLRLALQRQEAERRSDSSSREAQLDHLKGEQARLEAEAAAGAESMERLRHEIDRHAIRAPVAGWLGEVAELTVGSVVSEGDKVATVIPAGELRVAAYFAPGTAIGRIQPGQPAYLRLKAFPWAQYGTVAAEVTSVASEPREQRIRVDLAVGSHGTSSIILQHGQTLQVDVEVEHISPAALLLRIAGRQITTPRTAEP